ncbi:MAG: recombination protein RecR [Planctomycetes bacterium]|nr:recombination protein RecR [Planctomycetota bacterium]
MSSSLTGPLQRLIDELKKLPGVGSRSAERMAFHLLKSTPEEAVALAQAIRDIKEKVKPCTRCFNLADDDLCSICADERRDRGVIVVVEQPKDLLTFEGTGLITGVYHVLMGRIAPLEGIGPQDLTIAALVERVKRETPREVVLATNPTLEGDATALHIQALLTPLGVRITRPARGLAPGGQIEYANRTMLEEALRGRREI